MAKLKFLAAALAVAGSMALAANCQAQNQAPLFNVAGAASTFNSFALAAAISNAGGQSGVCGDHNWTLKNGATAVDNRSAQIAATTGNVWIVWNDTPEPNRTVCAYVSVDSGTAVRLFLAAPIGSLSLPPSDVGANGGNLVPLLPPDTPLPQSIYNDLNGQVFNAAPTDFRPEDALYATTRALTALNQTNYSGLGYGPGPIGSTILSSFSSKDVQVVSFALPGQKDPISGQTVPAAIATDVGASPFVIFVNTTDSGPAGLGNTIFNNVDRFVLGGVFSGQQTRTRDLIPSSGLPVVPLTIITRDPLAAAYNVVEFCDVRSTEVSTYAISQELGVNPSEADGNPLDLTYADGAVRKRAIGSSEEVSEVGDIADSIGYAAWSFGNFAPVLTTAKYLTVDGVDPLYASTSQNPNGPNALPQCSAPCPGAVTLANVINGSYPLWNITRVISATPVPAGISEIISAAQSEVANIPDFVPINQLEVFRSHYTQSGVAPNNGHERSGKESGGDMGGAVFTIQADLDFIADTGAQILNHKQ